MLEGALAMDNRHSLLAVRSSEDAYGNKPVTGSDSILLMGRTSVRFTWSQSHRSCCPGFDRDRHSQVKTDVTGADRPF